MENQTRWLRMHHRIRKIDGRNIEMLHHRIMGSKLTEDQYYFAKVMDLKWYFKFLAVGIENADCYDYCGKCGKIIEKKDLAHCFFCDLLLCKTCRFEYTDIAYCHSHRTFCKRCNFELYPDEDEFCVERDEFGNHLCWFCSGDYLLDDT